MHMADAEQAGIPDHASPEQEHAFHYYRGNEIPWYIRVIWLGFWIFTVYYIIRYFFPAMQVELVLPP
ncbi:MAG: hypothetical protein H7Z17_07155 [Fuerstia sp.]|nr:hypothetical protein [Fuerstiella sp.]